MIQPVSYTRIIISSLLLVLIFLMGALLYKSGKPYNPVVFTFHKMASLAFVAYFLYIVYNLLMKSQGGMAIYVTLAIFILSAVILFVSGALISQDKYNDLMITLHRVSTGTFILSLVVAIFLLLKKS